MRARATRDSVIRNEWLEPITRMTTGSSSVFSMRIAYDGYTGNCLRVRRSSDNAEQDIPFYQGWIDEANLLAFCGAGNGFVTKWYNQQDVGKDVHSTVAAEQPQIVFSGVMRRLSGKPSMYFDGTNSGLYMPTGTQVACKSWFGVMGISDTEPASMYRRMVNMENASGGTSYITVATSTVVNGTFYEKDILVSHLSPFTDTKVLFCDFAGAWTSEVGIGVAILGAVPYATQRWMGDFSEFVLFPSTVTTAVRQKIQRNQMRVHLT